MAQFITKIMSNTLPTMKILQKQVHTTTNLCPRFVITPETIQHIYQCIHKIIRNRWTLLVDALHKWIKVRNTDPDISILLADTLLYIVGKINDLPQCPNLILHPAILYIGWLSIILGIIPKSLALTQQTYFNHIRSKKRDLNEPVSSSYKSGESST